MTYRQIRWNKGKYRKFCKQVGIHKLGQFVPSLEGSRYPSIKVGEILVKIKKLWFEES